MVCYKHPNRETLLRCNQCGRPICQECAVKVPTGYRCKECVREQQKRFDTSKTTDYFIGAVIAFLIGSAGSFIAQMIPYIPQYFTALILGGLCGRLTVFLVRKAVNKRRSGKLTLTVTAAAGIGALLPCAQSVILYLSFMFANPVWLFSGLMQIFLDVLFAIVICTVIHMEMSGMIFRG